MHLSALAVPMPIPVELTPYRPEFRERLVTLWRASFALGVEGGFHTPAAHLGITPSLLFVLRPAWRFVALQTGGHRLEPPGLQIGASPPAMAIFGTLAGCYAACALGLLRWRARMSLRANAEH
jgi:hypothetical protein